MNDTSLFPEIPFVRIFIRHSWVREQSYGSGNQIAIIKMTKFSDKNNYSFYIEGFVQDCIISIANTLEFPH